MSMKGVKKMVKEKITEEEKYLISNYMKEWEILHQYVSDMDKGYINYITIFTAIATVGVSVLALIPDIKSSSLNYLFYLIPLIFVAVFGCLSYQFRVTAILHGHLASVEERVNELMGENVFMWHSALTEVYMAHNNVPNKDLMFPIGVFVVMSCFICGVKTFTQEYIVGNILYWLIVVCLGVFVLVPFFYNDTVRWETYQKDKVLQKYEHYKYLAINK